MKTLTLAVRNLLRNRRRSLLTLAAIAVGSFAVLTFGGYVVAIVRVLQTDTVRAVGHLQIQARGQLDFGRANPGRFAVHDYEALIARLRADDFLGPRLAVVTPVLQVQGVAGNFAAGMSTAFAGQGVIAAEQNALQTWDGLRTGRAAGRSPLPEDANEAGFIGHGMAQLLALCGVLSLADCRAAPDETATADDFAAKLPDDIARLAASSSRSPAAKAESGKPFIELLSASPNGAPNVVRMQVLAAERQGVRELDNVTVGMPLALAQTLVFGAGKAAVSAIVVQLRESNDLEAARRRLHEILAERKEAFEVHDFHAISPGHDQVIHMFAGLFRLVALLMGIVSLFSVANAVNMAVSERIGEIGTLRALGFQQAHIRRLFVAEGALLGLSGALLGGLLAVVMAEVVNRSGFGWTPPGRSSAVPLWIDLFGDSRLPAFTALGLIALAALSSWLPARRGAHLKIVEALRHV